MRLKPVGPQMPVQANCAVLGSQFEVTHVGTAQGLPPQSACSL